MFAFVKLSLLFVRERMCSPGIPQTIILLCTQAIIKVYNFPEPQHLFLVPVIQVIKMGKKHAAPPQPIDIFNAPSPRTLLTSSGDKGLLKRTRDSSNSVTVAPRHGTTPGAAVTTPTGSGPAFPESPPPETIVDYGDADVLSTSADSDYFSSEGNDGNDVGADEEDFDEEEVDEENGEEEEEDDEAYEDDEEDATHINLDFDALPMDENDIDSVMHLMDQLIPDHMNDIDRDVFGQVLAKEPLTTLIQLAEEDGASPLPPSMMHDNVTGTATDVFGLVSLLNIGDLAVNKKNTSAIALRKFLEKNIWSVVHPGLAPHFLMTAQDDSAKHKPFKCVWLISEHIRNVPLQMVSRALDFTWESFEKDVADAQKTRTSSSAITNPCMILILAKIQRDAEKAAALTKREKGTNKSAHPPAKQKRRLEAATLPSTAASAPINVEEDFIFWREEDSILYANRDVRVAVHSYRCRAQYDMQPESERPVTLAFVLSAEGLRKGLAQIRKMALE